MRPIICKSAADLARRQLGRQLRVIQKEAEGVRLRDPDTIHDMRVASRRLRAILTEFAPVLPPVILRKRLNDARMITRALGRPRELDVSCSALAEFASGMQGAKRQAADFVFEQLARGREHAVAEIRAALRIAESAGFRACGESLLDGMDSEDFCLTRHAEERLLKRRRKLQHKYETWVESLEEPSLHDTRIALKKFRYACETYAPLYGPPMKAIIIRLKKLQEALGDWNDLRVVSAHVLEERENAPLPLREGMDELCQALRGRMAELLRQYKLDAGTFFSPWAHARFEAVASGAFTPCCNEGAFTGAVGGAQQRS